MVRAPARISRGRQSSQSSRRGPLPAATEGGPSRLSAILALTLLLVYLVMAAGSAVLEWAVHGPGPYLLAPVLFSAYELIGCLIILRRGSHAIGWILQAIGPILLVMISSEDYAGYALQVHPGSLPFGQAVLVMNLTIWAAAVFLFAVMLPLLFPTGRLLSRRWLAVVGAAALYLALVVPGNALVPGSTSTAYPKLKNPIGIEGHTQLFQNLANASLIPGILAIIGVIAALIVRYRRSAGAERAQLRWFFFSALLIPLPLLLNGVHPFDEISVLVVLPLLPVSIGIAVLRYRLYGIDIVINRAILYGALAAFITAVYVGIVVGIGAVLGQSGQPNLGLSILATAVVAVGFQPVRERLQKIANRLVYGDRATPYEVLSEFSERVADSYADDDVLPRMARVLGEGTNAQTAQVWLRAGETLRLAAEWPAGGVNDGNGSRGGDAKAGPGGRGDGAGAGAGDGGGLGVAGLRVTDHLLSDVPEADRATPVLHQGELLGALTVRKRRGESLTPIEEKLLDDLAHQAGLVLKNVALTADLQARLDDLGESRKRLVAAQDQERRRLERNLRDGAQKNLVAIQAKLRLAETLAAEEPEKAKRAIQELTVDADAALEGLRDLARGIYPPLLADKGLEAALGAQARKATLPVTVEAEGIGRYPQEVEAAVYFCGLEALQNVQKYAGASRATVRLREEDGDLIFEVEDDGQGFDPAAARRGSGLTTMADRLDALGGGVEVHSSAGAGTRLSGRVPASPAVQVA